MKEILIKATVPDDTTPDQIRVTYPGAIPGIAASFKVVEPPTGDTIYNEIRSRYPANTIKGLLIGYGAQGFSKGAKWVLKQMGL